LKELYKSITVVPSIKELEIVDAGTIDYAFIYFKPGLNLILGRSATGKTTVLDCIKEKSSFHMDFLEWSEKNSVGENIRLLLLGVKGIPQGKCLLMGDIFCRLDKHTIQEIAQDCSRTMGQIIATVPDDFDIYDFEANLIDTEEFDLK